MARTSDEHESLTDADLVAQGMQLAVTAQRFPDRAAVLSPHGSRTFAALNARANQLAAVLRAAGLQPGDAVAVLGHNSPEFVEVWAATQRSGLRLTPVNWHQSPENVAYIVDNCDAKALVVSGRFPVSAAAALKQATQLKLKLAYGGEVVGYQDYENALAGQEAKWSRGTPGTVMFYTSGTTGRPKGVYRRNRPFASQFPTVLNQTAAWQPGRDLALVTGPLYHGAPLVLNLVIPLAMGVSCYLMDGWDAEETLRLVEQHQVTHMHLVPTMMHRLLQLPEAVRAGHDLRSLRWVLHGAAPCAPHLKQAFMDWLGPVAYEYYSSTEGAGTFITPEQWRHKPGSVGKPLAGVTLRIMDEQGEPLPAGQEGLIYTKVPSTGRFEYYKDPQKTVASYRGEWFTLGDVGRMDADGDLFLTGRLAELIISGGVNIYPSEIDHVLLRHPQIADVAAVGVPNEEWGEEIKAVVELKAGIEASDATAESILSFAREHLPGFQRPRSITFVAELPRNAAGKVLRGQVRAGFWQGRDRAI